MSTAMLKKTYSNPHRLTKILQSDTACGTVQLRI